MKDLSVVILSYNTEETTKKCLERLITNIRSSISAIEVIVADNNSSDGSIQMLQELKKEFPLKILKFKKNYGFSKANNLATQEVVGRYVLYLNSDVIIQNVDFGELIAFMDSYQHVGALTVRMELADGTIDPASHRGFPTLWRSLCYFSGLEKIFGGIPLLNKVFGGYHLLHENFEKVHTIDSPSGAFFFIRKKLLEELSGFDETFFMYGEDIDLAYRIKQHGYSIEFNPNFSVLHLKYSSGLKNTDPDFQQKIRNHFYEAMKIFYNKHYRARYPAFVTSLIFLFIDLKNKYL